MIETSKYGKNIKMQEHREGEVSFLQKAGPFLRKSIWAACEIIDLQVRRYFGAHRASRQQNKGLVAAGQTLDAVPQSHEDRRPLGVKAKRGSRVAV